MKGNYLDNLYFYNYPGVISDNNNNNNIYDYLNNKNACFMV